MSSEQTRPISVADKCHGEECSGVGGAERCCNGNKSEQTKLPDKEMAEQNGASPGDVWGARSRSCACPTSELRSHVNGPASGPSALITAVRDSLEQTMTRMRDFNSRGPFGLSSTLSYITAWNCTDVGKRAHAHGPSHSECSGEIS